MNIDHEHATPQHFDGGVKTHAVDARKGGFSGEDGHKEFLDLEMSALWEGLLPWRISAGRDGLRCEARGPCSSTGEM